MTRFLKILLPAVFLTLGAGIGLGSADEREVNNVWWELEQDYNGSHQTVCVAENSLPLRGEMSLYRSPCTMVACTW